MVNWQPNLFVIKKKIISAFKSSKNCPHSYVSDETELCFVVITIMPQMLSLKLNSNWTQIILLNHFKKWVNCTINMNACPEHALWCCATPSWKRGQYTRCWCLSVSASHPQQTGLLPQQPIHWRGKLHSRKMLYWFGALHTANPSHWQTY